MAAKLYLSIGMPRAGSGWYYNLTHDLLVEGGGQDARRIRSRFGLHKILTEVNCNIGALTLHRLLIVLVPVVMGNTFVIKTHAGPTPFALYLIRKGVISPLYIYRDPRDALLSAYEYGQRSRQRNRENAFSDLTTIAEAVDFMQSYVHISETWLKCEQSLHTRYENMLKNYEQEASRLITFLGMDESSSAMLKVVENYRPKQDQPNRRGLHLAKGKIGRFREVLTAEQQELCLNEFLPFLKQRGYHL